MDDMHEFERQVASEVIRQMGQSRPVDPVAVFSRAVPHAAPTRRFQTMFDATRYLVAGIIVALFGGVLLTGVLTMSSELEQVPAATEPAQGASPTPSETQVRSSDAVRLAGNGPVLVWEQVDGPRIEDPYLLLHPPYDRSALVFVEGRYLLLDEREGTSHVFESTDGRQWTERPASELEAGWVEGRTADPPYRLGDGYITASGSGWDLLFSTSDGTLLDCESSTQAPCRSPVPSGTIVSLAVSPAGIVAIARTSSRFAVEEILGSDVAEGGWEWIPGWDKISDLGDEIWALETEDGTIHEVPFAEHGFLPDDDDWVYLGWHSRDGIEWTRMPQLRGARVLGTTEGFWLPDDRGPWFSADGLDWERVGWVGDEAHRWPQGSGLLVMQQADIERDRPARFLQVAPEGMTELPMSKRLARRKPSTLWDEPVTGPLGVVAVDSYAEEILFSADGSTWSLSPVPDAWSLPKPADASDLGPGAWSGTTFAVGDDEIIAIRSKCPARRPTAELCGAMGAFAGTLPLEATVWRGTVVEPTTEKG